VESYKLVLPEHLNHGGFLFGGNILKWTDEYAWIAATMEYPGCNFVTIGMEQVHFIKPVHEGTILRFVANCSHTGNSSVQYTIGVYRESETASAENLIFSAFITFVRLDEHGNKLPLS
jgi:acyl-CoA hydrolase